MMVFGIQLRHPSTTELAIVACLISSMAGIGWALNRFGAIDNSAIWPTVAGASVGIILNALGVSVQKQGLPAVSIMVIAATAVFFAFS